MITMSNDQLLAAVNKNTIREMTAKWTRNIVKNEKLIQNGDGITKFFSGANQDCNTENIPVVIVGGGPSLNKNKHLLKDIVNKAIIICVDSTLKVVMEMGIKPHMVVLTDASWGEDRDCFADLPMSTKGIPLIIDTFANKNSLKNWEGEVYWYAVMEIEGSPLSSIVEEEFCKKPIGRLACGGNVSSVAFSFAAGVLKCDPIVMIGQDCGFYDKQFHHADGIDVPEKLDILEVTEDIYGRPMYLTPTFKIYKYWFEKMVCGDFKPNIPVINGTFINATEGGSIKEGWLVQPFSYVISKYMKNEYKDLHYRLRPWHFKRKIHDKIKKRIINNNKSLLTNKLTLRKKNG